MGDVSTGEQEVERPKRKVPPIRVWVTDSERARVAELATQSGLSLSAYLLASGLNRPIRSIADSEAMRDLAKVNGDLGRVAGLLKLWLAEKRGIGAPAVDVDVMMREFRRLQRETLEIMGRVLSDR